MLPEYPLTKNYKGKFQKEVRYFNGTGVFLLFTRPLRYV